MTLASLKLLQLTTLASLKLLQLTILASLKLLQLTILASLKLLQPPILASLKSLLLFQSWSPRLNLGRHGYLFKKTSYVSVDAASTCSSGPGLQLTRKYSLLPIQLTRPPLIFILWFLHNPNNIPSLESQMTFYLYLKVV